MAPFRALGVSCSAYAFVFGNLELVRACFGATPYVAPWISGALLGVAYVHFYDLFFARP